MNQYQTVSNKIRALSLRLVSKANASHIGSALSIADLLAVLTSDDEICKLCVDNSDDRDRLILSKGHACVALYSALHLRGFFDQTKLFTYGDDYSDLMNHASHKVPGVEFSTGALGHGLPFGCGKALSAKRRNKDWHTFVIMSDGELQEGSNWESFMFAAHFNLNNLTACIDLNNLQSLTTVEETLNINPLDKKLDAFGWNTIAIDGHSHNQISDALVKAKSSLKPTALLLKTTKGKGVSFMENQVLWHYRTPNNEELAQALREVSEL